MAALYMCSYKNVFWKYAANLQGKKHMLKFDFNKVAKQLDWNHISVWVLSCAFAALFQNTFS